MSFPKILDGAHVLYFTQQGPYGMIQYTTGELADFICCLAIGKYDDGKSYYLFGCNADYEVVSDLPLGSIEECMHVANESYDCDILWIAVDQ